VSGDYFEEEEFESQFNGKTFLRILGLTKPHWKILAGFLIHHPVGVWPGFVIYLHQQAHHR
jgi:hypothetical protein